MKTKIILILTAMLMCGSYSADVMNSKDKIWMSVEYYYGQDIKNVPLGKCIATSFPKTVRDRPASLTLLMDSLQNPSKLSHNDDIIIILTPKEFLIRYDFIKTNDNSKRKREYLGSDLQSSIFDFIK